MLGSSVSHLPISSSVPLQAALLFLAERWFLLFLPRVHSCRDLRERVCTCPRQRWTHSRAHPRWRSRKAARARMDAPPASSSLAPAEASKRSSTTVHSVACAQSRRLSERLSAESPVRLSMHEAAKSTAIAGVRPFRGCLLELLKRLPGAGSLGRWRRAESRQRPRGAKTCTRWLPGGKTLRTRALTRARALTSTHLYLFSLSRCTSRITR